MLTLTCAHTTTTGKEKKTKNGEGISMLMDMHSNRLKKGSAATHRVTHKHTQISSLEATGRTRFKTRGGSATLKNATVINEDDNTAVEGSGHQRDVVLGKRLGVFFHG